MENRPHHERKPPLERPLPRNTLTPHLRHSRPHLRHSRESGNPGMGGCWGSPPRRIPSAPSSVIPAKAGIQGWDRGAPPRRIPSAPPPSFPRKREPRDGTGEGRTPKPPKLPETTVFHGFSTPTACPPRPQLPLPRHSRESGNPGMGQGMGPPPNTQNYRKLPEITAFHDFSAPTGRPAQTPTPHLRHSRESGNPGMGQGMGPPPNTQNYRKLPEITAFHDFSAPTGRPAQTPTPHLRHSRESGNPGMEGGWALPNSCNPPNYPKPPETTGYHGFSTPTAPPPRPQLPHRHQAERPEMTGNNRVLKNLPYPSPSQPRSRPLLPAPAAKNNTQLV